MARPRGSKLHLQLVLDRHGTGSLQHIQAALTYACERATQLLESPDDATALRAIHALSQAAAQYARVHEVQELSRRLDLLEAQLTASGGTQHGPSLHATRETRALDHGDT